MSSEEWLILTLLLVAFLFHRFPVRTIEIDTVKNAKGLGFSHPTRGDANDALPIWHSCIFLSF